MFRYFLEVSYKGNNYSGFQKQDNANSVQAEIEKAFGIFFRSVFEMTCSSRTDTAVHALQNFLHFDFEGALEEGSLYHINAILPPDIVVKNIYEVEKDAHCRFDAVSREYRYYIYRKKNPFLSSTGYFYPYTLDLDKLQRAAKMILSHSDFRAFSKRRTQAKTFKCSMLQSEWIKEKDCLVYCVKANRFLRGMVRGLVGTMLLVGRSKLSLEEFYEIVQRNDPSKADFSVPGHGLFLAAVNYPEKYFQD
ncbi:MAG: tRNA pseudouridine(38-40) synthase TruA [Bacteroidetes bacterium]|nr:tRNA pseudouridine(38-40) synthase TruA [Bacteroidota bacterium]